MPELDLTNAQAIAIANTDALEIRIANQTIWTKPAGPPTTPTHSVWYPNQYPYDLAVQVDVPTIRATGFYLYDETYRLGSKVVGARMWIPEGVTASEVTLYLWAEGKNLPSPAPNFDAPLETIVVPISGTGWISGNFSAKHDIITGSMVYIGYHFADGTKVVKDGGSGDYVVALDGTKLAMAEDTENRTWSRYDDIPDWYSTDPGHVFGLDIIVELPEERPTFFWDEYPTLPVESDSNNGSLTLATVLKPTVSGTVTHVRFPVPPQYVGTTVTAGIYLREDWPGDIGETTTIENVIPPSHQATSLVTVADIDRWKYVELPTPRHVNANEYMLVAAKFHAEGVPNAYFFRTIDNYFNSDITNSAGTLVGPTSGSIPSNALDGIAVNGRFTSPYNTGWPRYIYAARGYHIDVAFYEDTLEP